MPDAGSLEAMAWWGGGGALITFAGWAVARFLDLRATPFGGGRAWDPPPVEVPGFEPPDDGNKWHSPRTGLGLAVTAGLVGAAMGWSSKAPGARSGQFELMAELFAVAAAVFVLVR